MEFRIANTFTDSLARLSGDEQKAVKTTAFDLEMDPAHPAFPFHKLAKSRDKNFWSVRVSSDVRLIVHRTASSLLVCYVHHHDEAYRWAAQRKIEVHPKTGAAQLVEVGKRCRRYWSPLRWRRSCCCLRASTDELLGYGVPAEWVGDAMAARVARIETATDSAELEEVYATERHLLYVACTRARDYLLVSGVAPASEFLGDLQ